MSLIERVIMYRKLLGINKADDRQWYVNSDFEQDYYVALIDLYKHYCKVQDIDCTVVGILYE